MPRFFVRVELVDIARTHPSYDSLHEAMRLEGFFQELPDGQARYKLPPGEYTGVEPSLDALRVCRKVKDIASNVAQKIPTTCRVLVSASEREVDVARWNLEALS
jgi:hypothetical protein